MTEERALYQDGGAWIDAPKGSLVIAPGGTAHDFENRTAKRAGALNLSVPGDFEPHMKGIAEWFRALRRRVPHGERATQPIGQSRQPTRSKERARLNAAKQLNDLALRVQHHPVRLAVDAELLDLFRRRDARDGARIYTAVAGEAPGEQRFERPASRER